MAGMIPLLDTNVLIRFLTFDAGQKYKKLYKFFESLERGNIRVELKLIVLFQVVFVLKSFYKVPREQIADGLIELLKYKGIRIKEKKIIQQTLELWRQKQADIVDCYLIACLERNPRHLLYSYDRNFDKFNIRRQEP
jgi:predicted nucleic-acid-binding protein